MSASASKFPAFTRTDAGEPKKTKKRAARVPTLRAIEEKDANDTATPRGPPPISTPSLSPSLSPSPSPPAPAPAAEAAPAPLYLNQLLESDAVEMSLPAAPCFVIQENDPYNGRKKVSTLVVNLESDPREVAYAINASGLDTDRCHSYIGLAPKCADLDCVIIGYHGFLVTVKRDQVFVSSGYPEPNAALADPAKKLNAKMQARLIEIFRVIC